MEKKVDRVVRAWALGCLVGYVVGGWYLFALGRRTEAFLCFWLYWVTARALDRYTRAAS